jgi:NADH-quinone oxidoreductase subunit A
MILDEYYGILIALAISITLSSIISIGSYIVAFQKGDTEKVSPYECGFDPFEDARHKFQVKFYLVGILFLIFDLEVIYLFPWANTLISSLYNPFEYLMVMLFLLILTIGFVYEWKKGALEWE